MLRNFEFVCLLPPPFLASASAAFRLHQGPHTWPPLLAGRALQPASGLRLQRVNAL